MFQIDPRMFQIDPWLIIVITIALVAFTAVAEPKGTVFVQGEQWTAISEKGRVDPGQEVIITKVDGLKLYVTKK